MSWERLQEFGYQKCLGISSRPERGRSGRIFLVTALLLSPSFHQAFSATPSLADKTSPSRNLEEAIWLAEPDQLHTLEKSATRLVQEDPYSAYGHYLLAELYMRQFKQSPSQLRLLKQASELGQQAIDLSPSADYGYLVSAQVLDLMGYTDNALEILEGDPKIPLKASWRVSFLRGQMLSGQAPKDEVLEHFATSLGAAKASHNIIIPYIIATLHNSSQGVPLIEELHRWKASYPHRLFDLSLAMALGDNQQYKEAHKVYVQLQKDYPDFTEAFINDGIILYTQLNNSKDAQFVLKQALLSGAGLDATRQSLVKAHLARISLEHGKNFNEARALFAEAISTAKNPMEWIAFSHKAYEKNQRLQDFVTLLEDLRPTITGSSYLYALQGEVYSESLAQHEKAIESFSSAILLDPERSEFYNGLGLTYYRMHQLDKALSVFNEATKIDPQDATARYNQACVLAILGRSKEALGSLKAAIGLDPRLQQTARLDKDFTSMRVMPQFQDLTNTNPVAAGS